MLKVSVLTSLQEIMFKFVCILVYQRGNTFLETLKRRKNVFFVHVFPEDICKYMITYSTRFMTTKEWTSNHLINLNKYGNNLTF